MKRDMEQWIMSHPIVSFFLLSIALCFATLFPAIYLVPRDAGLGGVLGFYLGKIGVYSPVLAGMLVTRIIRPGRHRAPFARRLKISFPVWIVAVGIHFASLRQTAPPGVPVAGLLILSLPAALLPAWVISSAFSGPDGIRRMLATVVRPKGQLVYYLIALLTFPVITFVGVGLTNVLKGGAWLPPLDPGADLPYTLVVTFFFVLLFAGGLNEESGWRGFAQPRLQVKYNPLVSALILWFLMVIWHIPNDLLQYQHGGYLLVRIGLYPFITILFSWVFNRTNGSIPAVMIFHASMNSMNPLMGMFPITTAGNVLLIGFALAVLVGDRMWRRLPKDHPAVHQEETPVLDDGLAG